MLYTVRPLEKIYATPELFSQEVKADKNEGEVKAEYSEVMLAHGRVVTRRDGDNYIVEKVNSTDMSDYLNDKYAPGKMIKK